MITHAISGEKLISLILLCFLYITSGCYNSIKLENNKVADTNSSATLLSLFEGFEYVGSGQTNNTKIITSHDFSKKVLPSNLETDNQYIFHHRRLDGENVSFFELLQKRLKDNKIKIIEAKLGIHRFIGGYEFQILFQTDKCKGIIYTSLHTQTANGDVLYEKWDLDDYIIELETASH